MLRPVVQQEAQTELGCSTSLLPGLPEKIYHEGVRHNTSDSKMNDNTRSRTQ